MSNNGKLALHSSILSRGAASNCTGTNTATNGCIDLAEEFPAVSSDITKGELVSLNSDDDTTSSVVKTAKAYDGGLVGVVPTNPAIIISGKGVLTGKLAQDYVSGPESVLVALTGRVPVKISLENGDIKKGDYLTSSGTKAGMAMKATKSGRVIGIALESASSSSAKETILVLINPHYAGVELDTNGSLANFSGNSILVGESTINVSNLFSALYGYLKENLGIVFEQGLIKVNKLASQFLETNSIKTDSIESSAGYTTHDSVTGEAYCITVSNGELKTKQGSCTVNQQQSENRADVVVPSPSATPSPVSTPVSTPVETPVVTVSPEPSAIDSTNTTNAGSSDSAQPSAVDKVQPTPFPTQTVNSEVQQSSSQAAIGNTSSVTNATSQVSSQ